jgi:hypothetical protein
MRADESRQDEFWFDNRPTPAQAASIPEGLIRDAIV